MNVARVFITPTSMTPHDELAFIDCPPPLLALDALPQIDEVHVSVTFTWDMPRAETLAREWEALGVPVKMGGPAYNLPGGEFVESHRMCCYCLIGYRDDTFEAAEQRMTNAIRAGFMPYAMLYRGQTGGMDTAWRRFQREWLRPEIVGKKIAEEKVRAI
mgnify:CR=1 FL=1